MPDPSSISFPGPSRSNSLASTASSSGASLTRRSRITRKRSRTITQGSHRDEKNTDTLDQVLDISPANNADPALDLVVTPSGTPRSTIATHPRPGADSVLCFDVRNADADRSCTTFGTFGPPKEGYEALSSSSLYARPSPSQQGTVTVTSSEAVPSPLVAKGKVRHPSRLTSPPSSFKPTSTDVDRARSSLRDSLLTQQSSTSSSVYPMSSSMGTESPPSPSSPSLPDRGVPVLALELDGPKVQEFDADDVSYRLQLLVKNNYFLPPAHSKPSPADFPSALNHSKKAPSPTFLDLFRVGKPKSKPISPDFANGASPILRVTSDSTTSYGQRGSGKPSQQVFRPSGSQRMARVVVVREKMEDLAAAARRAEMDIGKRDFVPDRDRVLRRAKFIAFDGIVDPTETVDVPPPSANYPLALQASALHGLGIEDSVGAAILAERLPPPGSPGQSSVDPREDAWRKALLREAVGHSLNNSTATFGASRSSTPTRAPLRAHSSESLRPDRIVEQQRRLLDQKILKHPIIDPLEDFAPPASSVLDPSLSVADAVEPDPRRLSNLPLLRVETPVPHTPLSPPPRRPFYNPHFSQSQTNISPDNSARQAQGKLLRKSLSSPMLSDKLEYRTNGALTPGKTPPMPALSISPVPSSFDNRMSRITSVTRYTSSELDDQVADDHPGRPSLALTLLSTDGRSSVSECSQPSPTVSAFRDRMSDGYYSAHSGVPEESANASHNPSALNQHSRPPTMSPPPRPSSSVAGIALSPPPRTHYPLLQRASSRTLAISPTRSSSHGTVHSFASNSTLPQVVRAPPRLDLNVSSQSFHSALHSAPPPSSTAEFFDHIQAHTDAMDDLDDTDDSASETDPDVTAVFGTSPRRPKLMRLGNLSTPNVYPGAKEPYYPSVISTERRRPVGHTATRTPYFSRLKGAPDSLTHLSLAQHSREHLPSIRSSPDSRPATAGAENVAEWQKDQKAFEESSRRLNGLLIRHMQAEKDTLKRIAETAKVAQP